jgi:GTP cyclohydrolase I
MNGHGHLRALPTGLELGTDRGVDLAAAERAATDLLTALGADLADESVSGTPRRIAKLYDELLTPAPFDVTTFPNDGGYDELVVAREIPFHSLCARSTRSASTTCSRSSASRTSATCQGSGSSRLTTQIAGWFERELEPRGVGVVLEAEHLCVSLRGVQKQGATTVTSALHRLVRDDPRTRQEFLALTGRTVPNA